MALLFKTVGETIFLGDNGLASWLAVTPAARKTIALAVINGEPIDNESYDATPIGEWDLHHLGAKEMSSAEIEHRYLSEAVP